MMMGDPAASSDDSSPTPDRATTVAEARADVAASDASDAATTSTTVAPASSDGTASDLWADAAKVDAKTFTTTTAAGSDDIINQFASGWEKTSADITSTSSTTIDPFKNNWDGSPVSATSTTTAAADDQYTFSWERPSTTTSSSTPNSPNSLSSWESALDSSNNEPAKNGVLTEMNKLLGKTESPDGMWIQQHAVGHKGRSHRLVSIRLHKSK